METTDELDDLLYASFSVEKLSTPDLSLVEKARRQVQLRKKNQTIERHPLFEKILAILHLRIKVYHLGLCMVLVFAGFLFVNENNYSVPGDSGVGSYHAEMSAQNTTVCVSSSTMLTSIPTLVIRN